VVALKNILPPGILSGRTDRVGFQETVQMPHRLRPIHSFEIIPPLLQRENVVDEGG
jgi:hypothetical protein